MAIDEAEHADASGFSESDATGSAPDDEDTREPTTGSDVRVGAYTWADFMSEHGHGSEVSTLYPQGTDSASNQLGLDADGRAGVPRGDDWDRVEFDPTAYLGVHPDELESVITETLAPNAKYLWNEFLEHVDPETTPVTKDVYSWEHYKWEYYYDDDGSRPRARDGSIDRFDGEATLGFDPDEIGAQLHAAGNAAMALDEVVDERTVNVSDELDEDEFFTTEDGNTTVVNRYDLEKAVPLEKKWHFQESERYWVNKPYAFVIIFHSEKENEKKYYVIEPYCNEIETELQTFLSGKLRTAIKYSEESVKTKQNEDGRRSVIERETRRLLKRYDLFAESSAKAELGIVDSFRKFFDDEDGEDGEDGGDGGDADGPAQLEGIEVRPEPVILEEDPDTLNEYQVEKLLYLLKRNFIGYERIDPIKHDINVEDISCDGYNSPVFVYHSEYEQIISNVYHGEDDLDDFVVKLAQRSGKGISKRLPQVDATLPDGSRAQLTLGKEVSDHGTNYTIRQFKDVPFTPIDLVNWNTFSLDEMAFLWLCIENHKSLIFAGGTASGKTTSLNAVSLFIPANTKIVSIEDTREVELPQRNWIASMTRPSFSDDSTGDIDEFDLLEAALRQRPDYIVMGEIRGEEGRTLFQVMSTGHTTYTTFHADSVDEVLKRFTTDPINVSKTMFTALDLVSIQTQTRVQGRKVRRNKSLTEINHYEAENDEINVQDVYQWQAETDEYLKMGDSNTLDEIMFDRGWSHEKLQEELFKRKVILAYLIKNGLNTYAEVAATIQAFINDQETILTLIANGQLEKSLDDLREMESVLIDVDQEKEELVPRPDASSETFNLSMDILERAEESLFEEYRGKVPSGLASALGDVETADQVDLGSAEDDDPFDFDNAFDAGTEIGDWDDADDADELTFDEPTDAESAAAEAPAWLEDETGTDTGAATVGAGTGTHTSSEDAAERRPELEEPTTPTDAPELEGGIAETAGAEGELDDDGQPDTLELEEPTPETGEASSTGTSASEAGAGDDGDGIESLFTDMRDTLEALESADPMTNESTETGPDERSGSTASDAGGPDTSDFDAMFPERDMDSIFSDGSSGDSSEPEWDLGKRAPPKTDDRSGWSPDDTPEADDEVAETGDVFEMDDGDASGEGDAGDDVAGSDGENIFGSNAESVFSGEKSEDDDDDGPMFGGESTEDSIFGGEPDSTADGEEAEGDGEDEK
ncbi:ATPase, T2SS/T4P/T4SS family [Halovivax sp.]|uniref:ATPase, T2SS/T4P/T4SS family n=1 Tax=Halovivax sp. TaxID=1935978 RepID=UPI0025BDEB0F|nr:ATPase, T2SS/T4P/T4SS family [Halovivax sp.]